MAENRPMRLLLTGGGTGGHLFPAIATAQEILSRIPETRVMFVGTRRKVDARSLEIYGFERESITCYGFKGKHPIQLAKALMSLPLGYFQALGILSRFRPDLVLGVGGYVTGPMVAAARRKGVPVVLHEQNAIPGLANRKLAPMAQRVCLSLPGSEKFFPESRTVLTGNPVRKELLEIAGKSGSREAAVPTVLVIGGSQGAVGLNRMVEEVLEMNDSPLASCRMVHQTGSVDHGYMREVYARVGRDDCVEPFFTDMASRYEKADLVICRAGATTLAELAVLGKPAILVPYPHAADNHQEKNGEYYVRAGGAVMVKQQEEGGRKLAEQLRRLLEQPARLNRMAERMRRASYPDAASHIADCCLEVAGRGQHTRKDSRGSD